MAKDISTEIGFDGGGSTAVSMPEDAVKALLAALEGSEQWHTVESSDGATFVVDTTKVVFVRVGSTTRSIGFAH